MSLALIFYISIYGLAMLSGGILTWAEGHFFPTGLTVPIAVAAFYLNERWRLIRLSGLSANLLALLAFVFPALEFFEFFGRNEEGRLLAGAHLMVLLQWIVLLQDKQPAHYWWVFALSILQVAVSAVLQTKGLFGFLLILYLLAAMWSLSVFSLYQGEAQFRDAEVQAEPNPDLLGVLMSPTGAGVLLPPGIPVFAISGPHRAVSMVRSSIPMERTANWINGRFVAGVVGMTSSAIVIGMFFFLMIPRFWLGGMVNFRSEDLAGIARPLSGFSERVQLGGMSDILESTQRVMKVRFIDNDTNDSVDIPSFAAELGLEEPLFSGTILVEYDNGRWSPSKAEMNSVMHDREPGRASLRQEYELDPIGTKVLFAIRPFYRNNAGKILSDKLSRMELQHDTAVLFRDGKELSKVLTYAVYSPRHGRSGTNATLLAPGDRISAARKQEYLDLPQASLQPLVELAQSLTRPEPAKIEKPALAQPGLAQPGLAQPGLAQPGLAQPGLAQPGLAQPGQEQPEADVKPVTDADKVRILESYLRDSGEFHYSLEASIKDPNVDPVVDFLVNRKAGHCEYYASALALMLRAVDVPARLVTGFKGGFKNRFGDYEIQQRHAHAWVEAYVGNQWTVCDATPAAPRQAAVDNAVGRFEWWNTIRTFCTGFWQKYVLQMSLSRQQDELYAPLTKAAALGMQALRGQAATNAYLYWLLEFVSSPQEWFSLTGGLIALVLMVFASGTTYLAKRVFRLIRQFRSPRATHGVRPTVHVDFYDAFLKLVTAHGLVPGDAQTPREFADETRQFFADRLQNTGLSTLPAELSEAFYRVRFGWQALTENEHSQLLAQLKLFQDCLGAQPKH